MDMDADRTRLRRWQSEIEARLVAFESGARSLIAPAAEKLEVAGNAEIDALKADVTFLTAKVKAISSVLEKLQASSGGD